MTYPARPMEITSSERQSRELGKGSSLAGSRAAETLIELAMFYSSLNTILTHAEKRLSLSSLCLLLCLLNCDLLKLNLRREDSALVWVSA